MGQESQEMGSRRAQIMSRPDSPGASGARGSSARGCIRAAAAPRAARVALVAADVDGRDAGECERDVGERAARERRQAVPDLVDVYPVADLDRARALTGHQSERAEHARLVGREQAVLPFLADRRLVLDAAQALALEALVGRLVVGPRHPRPEVLETLADRERDHFRVAGTEQAQDVRVVEPDPLRRRRLS